MKKIVLINCSLGFDENSLIALSKFLGENYFPVIVPEMDTEIKVITV